MTEWLKRPVIQIGGAVLTFATVVTALGTILDHPNLAIGVLIVTGWLTVLGAVIYIFSSRKEQVIKESDRWGREVKKIEYRFPRLIRYGTLVSFGLTTIIGMLLAVFVFTRQHDLPSAPVEGRIRVVVAAFDRIEGSSYEPQWWIRDVVQQAADEVGDVEVIVIDKSIQDRTQAQQIMHDYHATMVIYGHISNYGVATYYEIRPFDKMLNYQTSEEQEYIFRVSASEVENYELFLFQGLDSKYVLGLIAGQLYYSLGRFDESIQAFSMAASMLSERQTQDMGASELYLGRGSAYFAAKNYEQAVTDYNEALRLKPDYIIAYNGRGSAYAFWGKYDLAMDDFNNALRLEPEDPNIYNNRGIAYLLQGENELAIADFNEALRFNPQDAGTYINRGTAYALQGEHNLAIANYDNALRLDPQDAGTYTNRGTAYAELGENDLATADFNEALRLNPQDAEAYNGRGNVYAHQGEYDLAIANYNEAIRLDPQNAEAYYNRGNAYGLQREYDLAIADYDEALRLNPQDVNVFYSRGFTYAAQEKYDLAIVDYNEALRLDPQLVGVYYNRGIAHKYIGEYDLAIADFSEVLRLDPQDPGAYYNRGIAYSEQGKDELALADLRQYVRLSGENADPQVADLIAQLEARLNQR